MKHFLIISLILSGCLAFASDPMKPYRNNLGRDAIIAEMLQQLKAGNSSTFLMLTKQYEVIDQQGFEKLSSSFISKREKEEFAKHGAIDGEDLDKFDLSNMPEGSYYYIESFRRNPPDLAEEIRKGYLDIIEVYWSVTVTINDNGVRKFTPYRYNLNYASGTEERIGPSGARR